MDRRQRGPAFFAYADNYLADTDHGIIVDVEATRAIRQAEVGAARTMIDRVEERFGLKPKRLAGDSAYGAAPMLAWLVKDRGIAPHIPVFDKSKRDDGTFSRADFQWQEDNNVYVCPAGKTLKSSGRLNSDNTYRYLASTYDCGPCPLKSGAAPRRRSARFHATSTRMLAMSPGRSTTRPPSTSRVATAKRSRCCLPTSSAF